MKFIKIFDNILKILLNSFIQEISIFIKMPLNPVNKVLPIYQLYYYVDMNVYI